MSQASEMFTAGNYAATARSGQTTEWQTHAALGLIGRPAQALTGLRRFDQPEARFYSAVAHWIAGDDDAAGRQLAGLDTLHAQNLLQLIQQPKITVMVQHSPSSGTSVDPFSGVAQDDRFDIRPVGPFQARAGSNQRQIRPYTSVEQLCDPQHPPDFYVCSRVEQQLIPTDLQRLDCPIIGDSLDFDRQLQTVYPWLQVFDEIVVSDPSRWEKMSILVSGPVSTFPKLLCIESKPGQIRPHEARPIDVIIARPTGDPDELDRAHLVHQLLQSHQLNMRFTDGTGESVPTALLANAKICFAYDRHGGIDPIALEALAHGCVVAARQESVLRLYTCGDQGLLTYDAAAPDLASVIQAIVRPATRRSGEEAARLRRVETILDEFSPARVGSQYLRYLTFLAARPHQRSATWPPTSPLDQKRAVTYGDPLARAGDLPEELRDRNVERWQERVNVDPCVRWVIDTAREIALECAQRTRRQDGLQDEQRLMLGQALQLYRKGLMIFPRSLVLRFNYVRTALHLGTEEDLPQALQAIEDVLGMPAGHWQVDPLEDVHPRDFFGRFFNYGRYSDLLACELGAKDQQQRENNRDGRALVEPILASLHCYLGYYRESSEHFEQAMQYDPDFPFYRLAYARALLKHGSSSKHAVVAAMLASLARGSVVANEALDELARLQQADPLVEVSALEAEMATAVKRLNEGRSFIDDCADRVLVAAPAGFGLCRPRQPRSASPRSGGPRSICRRTPLVSALVSSYNAERFMRELLEDLERQTITDELEIVIIDSNSPQREREIVREYMRCYDNIVYLRTEERENAHVSVNRAIDLSRGKYLALANTDDRHRVDALEVMADTLDRWPDVALVYADVAITAVENERLESATTIGYFHWPEFHRRRLFQNCHVGPQPMWRREIHERHGLFDPDFWSAGDYEFWLRLAPTETFMHIDQVLGLYLLSPTSNERAVPGLNVRETVQARQRYWPTGWGTRPQALTQGFSLPAAVLRPWSREAAHLHSVGILSRAEAAEVAELHQEAIGAVRRKDFTALEIMIRAAIERFPQLVSPYQTLYESLRMQQRQGELEGVLRAAASVNPYASFFLNRLGMKRHAHGDLPGAEDAYCTALSVSPQDPGPLINLGMLCYQTERPDAAASCLRRARGRVAGPLRQIRETMLSSQEG